MSDLAAGLAFTCKKGRLSASAVTPQRKYHCKASKIVSAMFTDSSLLWSIYLEEW